MVFFRFRYVSIRNKLVGTVICSWLLIAFLITSFFVGQDLYSFRKSVVADLAGLARVIGINCTAPLEFADSDTAVEVLSSLSAMPTIHQAAIYTRDEIIFARYQATALTDTQLLPEIFPYNIQEHGGEAHFFVDKHLDLYVPVQMEDKVLGTLLLRADLSAFSEKLIRTAFAVVGIMTASLFFAWIVSSMLERYISNPILNMAGVMRRVRQEKNYSLRIKDEFNDELGILADGFNSMVGHIQQRDKQLLDAKQVAEEANRAKSTFLAQMSHEIRTPMNGVIGIASLLLATPLNEKQTQFVMTIRRSGDALLNVINDILDFSKIEAGKLELEEIPFFPQNIAEDAIDLLSENACNKGLKLTCMIDPAVPPFVNGDPGRLRQVLMNLIGNAIKFTSKGHVDLNISLESKKDDEVCLLFEVSDSGIGIPKDKLDTIFSAFSQADDFTTRRFGGTGLGLVISKQLVELHRGTIGVESEPGKGSTFWFTAVYRIADESTLSLTEIQHYSGELQEKNREQTNAEQIKAHILVAEDNQTNQIVTRGVLESLGCSVEIVENGQEAVKAVGQNDYDIIFMDCHMPVMDGYEASGRIRENDPHSREKQIPIIALTAHAMKGDRDQCLAAGMDDYLSKPCTENQIRSVLKKWLPDSIVERPADRIGLDQRIDTTLVDPSTRKKPHGFSKNESTQETVCKNPAKEKTDPAPIDQSVLNTLRELQLGGQPDFLVKILSTYITTSEPLVAIFREALATDDLELLQNTAHSLKSSSASVGALVFSELNKELEMACRYNTLESGEKLVSAIEVEFNRVKEALKKEIE